jgi:hypothetical protein
MHKLKMRGNIKIKRLMTGFFKEWTFYTDMNNMKTGKSASEILVLLSLAYGEETGCF